MLAEDWTDHAPTTVTGEVTLQAGKSYDVKGDLKVDFREFGIEIPSYLGATVKPPVDVNVAFVLDDK